MKKPYLDSEMRWHIINNTSLGSIVYSKFLLLKQYVLLTKILKIKKFLNWLNKILC